MAANLNQFILEIKSHTKIAKKRFHKNTREKSCQIINFSHTIVNRLDTLQTSLHLFLIYFENISFHYLISNVFSLSQKKCALVKFTKLKLQKFILQKWIKKEINYINKKCETEYAQRFFFAVYLFKWSWTADLTDLNLVHWRRPINGQSQLIDRSITLKPYVRLKGDDRGAWARIAMWARGGPVM